MGRRRKEEKVSCGKYLAHKLEIFGRKREIFGRKIGIFGRKIGNIWHKKWENLAENGKYLAEKWELDSNLSFNFKLHNAVLQYRGSDLGEIIPQNYKKYPLYKVRLAHLENMKL